MCQLLDCRTNIYIFYKPVTFELVMTACTSGEKVGNIQKQAVYIPFKECKKVGLLVSLVEKEISHGELLDLFKVDTYINSFFILFNTD